MMLVAHELDRGCDIMASKGASSKNKTKMYFPPTDGYQNLAHYFDVYPYTTVKFLS